MSKGVLFRDGLLALYTPSQWFSKCGIWTRNIIIIWEIVRNANPHRPIEAGTLRLGPRNLCFN